MLDIIKERRYMVITIGILVVMNLGLITAVVLNSWDFRPRDERPRSLEHFLKMELELSEEQFQAMHDIRQQHAAESFPRIEELDRIKEALIAEALTAEPDQERARELAITVASLQAELELSLFTYFTRLNEICTPEQRVILQDLVRELIPRGGEPPGGGRGQQGGHPPKPGRGQEGRPPRGPNQGSQGEPPPPPPGS